MYPLLASQPLATGPNPGSTWPLDPASHCYGPTHFTPPQLGQQLPADLGTCYACGRVLIGVVVTSASATPEFSALEGLGITNEEPRSVPLSEGPSITWPSLSTQSLTQTQTIVPQQEYRFRGVKEYTTRNLPIAFSMQDGRNMSLRKALDKNFDGLIGRDDNKMFYEREGAAISIRIEWPGYPSFKRQFKTMTCNRTPRPITKAKLANDIARAFESFANRAKDKEIDPSHAEWRVGLSYLNADNIDLVALKRVSTASWQPVFAIRHNSSS